MRAVVRWIGCLSALAVWCVVSASSVRAQEEKLPSSEQTVPLRSADYLRRNGLIELSPLFLRRDDVRPLLQLVQNEPGAQPTPAPSAVPPTQGDVIVLLGTATGRGVDARVRRLSAVRHPPLSLYPNIRVLSWAHQTFRATPSYVTLPNGRRLSIAITQVLANGRFVVQTVMSPRAGQTGSPTTVTIEAAPGEPFFFAGQTHEGGTLIIGISVGAARRAP